MPTSDPVEFDSFRVKLLLPADADAPTADAARVALSDASFLASMRRAVRAVLDADPALAVLSAVVEW